MPSEQQLSEVLSEFARTMVTDFPIQAILDHFVLRIVDLLPVDAAGVTLISSEGEAHYVAASDESALRFEKLQTELGEGPCLTAYKTGRPIAVADLSDETRFSKFSARALHAGLVAVFSFPLHHGEEQLGALDLYRKTSGPLDAATTVAARTLADVASAYLLNAWARADLHNSLERFRLSALHDPLTKLPNRTLFLERLDHAILRARRSGTTAAVLFADLDGFKLINDLHGHGAGDEVLVEVARRLQMVLRPGDTLARLAGDEFVILCEDLENHMIADAIAIRVGDALATPFVLPSGEVRISASVGIAYAGRGDKLSTDLLQDADTAMYQAKRKGGARHQIINLHERDLANRRAMLKHDLRGAADRGELRVDYQPMVETGDGRLTGFEALVRWAHPTRGMLLPTFVVPLAEQSGLITEIGTWVLSEACAERNGWQNDALTMSVNVSPLELILPDFFASVVNLLDATTTVPDMVTLEVTESVFLQDSHEALAVLRQLKRLGVKLALDDFGTGYSSLNYLKRFPFDIVKIDEAFIADLEQDATSHAIVFAVIELAHILGMTVVAEGVETAEQHETLAAVGCDYCQGFYFAHPMAPDAVEDLIRQGEPGGVQRLPTTSTARP